jgi:hypothetical protein
MPPLSIASMWGNYTEPAGTTQSRTFHTAIGSGTSCSIVGRRKHTVHSTALLRRPGQWGREVVIQLHVPSSN